MESFKVFKSVLIEESNALLQAAEKLTPEKVKALQSVFQEMINSNGSLFFCGVGKSGFIARKLASTFSSLGRPSIFIHPTEALHGDLGLISSNDTIIFLSKSGSTEEIVKLLPYLNLPIERRIGLLGKVDSVIGEACGLVLDCSVVKEACINDQAPTTSSTLALAMGDAMAVFYENLIGLSKENFALNHPGGILGKQLRMKVADLACPANICPILKVEATLQDVVLAMTSKNVGGCAVVDGQDKFLGMIVEGDIRRTLSKPGAAMNTSVKEMMNSNPVSVSPKQLAAEALQLMEKRQSQISILPVLENGKFLGFIRLHDLIREGFQIK